MTDRRIHTNVKIFFPNPYVVRIEYPGQSTDTANAEFTKLRRRAYKQITGTWGHTNLEIEVITTAPAKLLSAYFPSDTKFVPRAYFCFKDEVDLLQFKLSVDAAAVRVYMWPSLKYTIHEFIDKDPDKE